MKKNTEIMINVLLIALLLVVLFILERTIPSTSMLFTVLTSMLS